MKNPKVAVFSGSRYGRGAKKNKELAYKLGQVMAGAKYAVINGGGPGLMEELSRGAHDHKGEVICVHLHMEKREESKYATKIYKYTKITPRQQKIISLADAFIILPGGLGTVFESIEVFVKKYFQDIDREKPMIFLGKSFWRPLINLINNLVKEGFIEKHIKSQFKVVDNPAEAIKILNKYFRNN